MLHNFLNIGNYAPFIQLLVGSVFIFNYYDDKNRNEPFLEKMKNTKVAIESIKQRFALFFSIDDEPSSLIDWYRERKKISGAVSFVLAVFGCILLLYSGIVNSVIDNNSFRQCCCDTSLFFFNLYFLLSIIVPSIILFVFLIFVYINYGQKWERCEMWKKWVVGLIIGSFLVFIIIASFSNRLCSSIPVVAITHIFAIIDCVLWIGIRYGKSLRINNKYNRMYFQLVKLYYKARLSIEADSNINLEGVLEDFQKDTHELSKIRTIILKKYIHRLTKQRIDKMMMGNNNQSKESAYFSETVKKLDENCNKDIDRILKKIRRIGIPDFSE